MTHLFAGFPRAIEAFQALREAAGNGSDATPVPAPETRGSDAGAEMFRQVYGRQAPEVRKRLRSFHPEFERAVLEDAYGRILARPGIIDPRTRELMAVCALTAARLPRQLRSHLLGALRFGAGQADTSEMIELALEASSEPAVRAAREVLAEVLSRSP